MNGWEVVLEKAALAGVLLYVVMRLEKAMHSVEGALMRVCDILMLVLRRIGVRDEDALDLVAGRRACDDVRLPGERLPSGRSGGSMG